jgi:uracil-DNA glycosylase family 4
MPQRPREFNPRCTDCPRLARFLKGVRESHPDYFARPVPPFGDARARLLIVGLAPGMHGANRTGRPFTGDFAGILLYQTLHKLGLATRSESVSADDPLRLRNCRITNAVKCVPPANKPLPTEIQQCNTYLTFELEKFPKDGVILALGKVAHDAVIKSFALRLSAYKFAHGAEHELPNGLPLIDSYHCSRYNTQTRRLTTPMFERVVRQAAKRLG